MKDKITLTDFENLCVDPVIKNAAKDFYELHQQALQQILEEAGEELPDENKVKVYSVNSGIAVKGLMGEFWKKGAEWMRSEASKVVAKKNKEYKLLLFMSDCVEEELKKEIQQLKEELARKEFDGFSLSAWIMDRVRRISLSEEWYSEGYRYFIQASRAESVRVKTMEDVIKHYQASKTYKP